MPASVTVLCPNGRRAVVKVSPNTSILQIIEDACTKHGFNPDQYDLKHLRRVLDTSSSMRYSGLPNNCQLELIESAVPRTASSVTVNIATDDGVRLVHDFIATSSLWDILKHHEESGQAGRLIPPPEDGREPVIVYTMRRISGQDLKTTTLKSLGLTSGKCMLRHSIQSVSSNTQAHVAKPLSRPKVQQHDEGQEVAQKPQSAPQVAREPQAGPSHRPEPEPVRQPPPPQRPAEPPSQILPPQEERSGQQQHVDLVSGSGPDLVSSSQSGVPDLVQSQNNVAQPDVVTDGGGQADSPVPMDLIEGHEVACSSRQEEELPSSSEAVEKVIKFGSHDAILFNMDDAPNTNLRDEGDDFFELTVNEVKNLYCDQQRVLKELNETPLMTQQMREMEENAKVLHALHHYPVTQLRIYFPDNNVIQASFKPTNTISQVEDFIRPLLANPASEFSLLLRHPHRVLATDLTLVAADCVPNARIYFEAAASSPPYLNDETLSKKSSFSGAVHNVVKRKQHTQNRGFSGGGHSLKGNTSQAASTSQESGECSQSKRTNVNYKATGATPKVPKWFKTNK
ncbi:tether containing UBX domain for GLUT4-like [Penaeus japonicus]|uniref:tether containing UBX domain for GLUT4-like n=1 Tax=Penaeus japonicus TaxID=27405 RepID=UPI001C713B31|nr:tether containing UBX domain for GLUT4-like [Penaeus japonicus]